MVNAKTARRDKLAELQRKQQAKSRRRRQLGIGGVVVAVLVIAAVIGIAVQGSRNTSKGGAARPAGALANGALPVGPAAAPVTLDVYEDFQCPICGRFEKSTGATVTQLVQAGTAKVNYHLLSFIGPESARAANAAGCAAQAGAFEPYRESLFAHQPPERSGGYTNPTLVKLGQDAGLSGSSFTSCVNNDTYGGWVRSSAEDASKRGVNATPTVLANGKQLDSNVLFDPKQFQAAVEGAKKA